MNISYLRLLKVNWILKCYHLFLLLAMEELFSKQDDVLTTKDAKIKELKLRLVRQKQIHQQQLSDLDIHRQQEQYINYNTQKSQENTKRTRQKRVTFR